MLAVVGDSGEHGQSPESLHWRWFPGVVGGFAGTAEDL